MAVHWQLQDLCMPSGSAHIWLLLELPELSGNAPRPARRRAGLRGRRIAVVGRGATSLTTVSCCTSAALAHGPQINVSEASRQDVRCADLVKGNEVSGLPHEAVHLAWKAPRQPGRIEVFLAGYPASNTCATRAVLRLCNALKGYSSLCTATDSGFSCRPAGWTKADCDKVAHQL